MLSINMSGRDPLLLVNSKMEMAKGKDILERERQYPVRPSPCFPIASLTNSIAPEI